MNLRGEIVTLVDIRGLLNMPIRKVEKIAKAMIIEVGEVVAGAIVEDVFDVMYLNPSDIKGIPAAVHSANSHEEYLIGTAKYGNKMMSIVDLPKIMMQGGLAIEEYI
jgi:purine-binding chemotaxis protein CheW